MSPCPPSPQPVHLWLWPIDIFWNSCLWYCTVGTHIDSRAIQNVIGTTSGMEAICTIHRYFTFSIRKHILYGLFTNQTGKLIWTDIWGFEQFLLNRDLSWIDLSKVHAQVQWYSVKTTWYTPLHVFYFLITSFDRVRKHLYFILPTVFVKGKSNCPCLHFEKSIVLQSGDLSTCKCFL